MKVLLTGATGFLGSSILKYLVLNGNEVVILKRSSSDLFRIQEYINEVKVYDIDNNINSILKIEKPPVIIHTACLYGKNNETSEEIIKTNVNFGIELFQLGLENGLKTFINTDTLLPKSINIYSKSKSMFRDFLFEKHKQVQIVNIRIELMYGYHNSDQSFLITLVKKIINSKSNIDLTYCEQERDLIHVDDVVSAYGIILKNLNNIPIKIDFPLVTGNPIKLKKIILLLTSAIFKQTKINSEQRLLFGNVKYRKGELMKLDFNNNFISSLGWEPKINLKEGINHFVKKIINNESY